MKKRGESPSDDDLSPPQPPSRHDSGQATVPSSQNTDQKGKTDQKEPGANAKQPSMLSEMKKEESNQKTPDSFSKQTKGRESLVGGKENSRLEVFPPTVSPDPSKILEKINRNGEKTLSSEENKKAHSLNATQKVTAHDKLLAYDDPLARSSSSSKRKEVSSVSTTAEPTLELVHRGVLSQPGAFFVPGMNATNDNRQDEDYYQNETRSVPDSEGDADKNEIVIATADLVDPDKDEKRIINSFVRRTAEATLVERPRFWNKRNMIIIVISSIAIVVSVIVLVLLLLLAKDEGTIVTEEECVTSCPWQRGQCVENENGNYECVCDDGYNYDAEASNCVDIAYDKTLKTLSQISDRRDILKDGSPQNLAFFLLLDDYGIDASMHIERYIALVLYFATGGKYWSHDLGFLKHPSVCEWNDGTIGGLRCNQRGEIISIDTGNNNLTGTLPSEIFNLPSLEILELPNNELQGSIPSPFDGVKFEVGNLAVVDLSGNSLTGMLPEYLLGLKGMRTLRVGYNKLTGAIPHFQPLNGYLELHLNDNDLSGSIPKSINELSSLKTMNLTSNHLDGTIPLEIGQMTYLELLYLSNNPLSGPIPFQVQNLDFLKSIEIAYTNINGTIPKKLGELRDLTRIYLNENELTGTIPLELASLEKLISFQVSGNKLTGTVPRKFSSSTSLVTIDIQGNNITDSLDEVFCTAENEHTPLIGADCRGDHPKIDCSCCEFCYDSSGTFIRLNQDVCLYTGVVQFWIKNNLEIGEVSCGCNKGEQALSCSLPPDENCVSCNLDETTCTSVSSVTFELDGRVQAYMSLDFKYIEGSDSTVSFQVATEENFCEVSVDGKTCEKCNLLDCGPNGARVPQILCKDIDGVDIEFNGCDLTKSSDAGLFEVFQWMVEGNLYSENSCVVPNLFDVYDLF